MNSKNTRIGTVVAISVFTVIGTWMAGGPVQSIGGLCNGTPASSTDLDASGQYGPALIDGTRGDDVIIGSDGDDTIDAGLGNDTVCGAAGDDSITGGDGNDAIRGDTGDDDLDGGAGQDTVVGDGGNDTVAGGLGRDFLSGGSGDDVMVSSDDEPRQRKGKQVQESIDKVNAGDDFDVCLFSAGDELANCEY
jgi:Ca2+-binding RTX toxin-like protein